MTTRIAELLASLGTPGNFATRIRGSADDLSIAVTGVGPLSFPISPATATKLRAVSRASPFGWKDQTLHDESVRSSWEVATSRVKIKARPWKKALAGYLRELQPELGVPDNCELEPVFDKLLLYERGQFFKPHQDSERSDEMVGTLVVLLPSQYTGGAVTVEHRDTKKTFRRLKHQDSELSLLAFYSDCQHQISPVKSGYRVALTYHLLLKAPAESSGWAPAANASTSEEALAIEIRRHFATPIERPYSRRPASPAGPPARLVYLLDHEYTQRSLAWNLLKAADRKRVDLLRAAALELDCECHLALADVHEVWGCDGDEYPYDGFWRSRRGGRRYQEPSRDTDDYDLVDLHDTTIQLRHWLDSDGESTRGIPSGVDTDELCFTIPSVEMDPFESEHEGWQGNYGNTVERWYHRAALVMWPRKNSFALRAQGSPAWALKELGKLPVGQQAELEVRVGTLLPTWLADASQEKGSRFFEKLATVARRLESSESALEFCKPIGSHRLKNRGVRTGLVSLVEQHGRGWGQQLFEYWAGRESWQRGADWLACLEPLAEFCEDLVASKHAACRALSKSLVAKESARVRERCVNAARHHGAWLELGEFDEEARGVAHLLAAAAAAGLERVITRELKDIASQALGFSLPFRVAILREGLGRYPSLRKAMLKSKLHTQVVKELDEVIAAPSRTRGDWTIEYRLSCDCRDCSELARYLRSTEKDRDWPLAKERRQHIHGTISASGLPVEHTTLRQGSPQLLQLRKTKQLFSREAAYQRALKAARKSL